jgi:hypothetical protein
MSNFFEVFRKHEAACAESLKWLNENANFISKNWHLWHSGGGFTHYRAEGDVDGKKCYFLLCHDGVAEPKPVQQEASWVLSANEIDAEGEDVAFAVLASDFNDMHEAVLSAKKEIKDPNWIDLTAPPAPR